MLGYDRQDIYYIAVHGIMFLTAYSAAMTGSHDWFDWRAFNMGLIALGGTTLGSNLLSKNQTVTIKGE
jgi:hypothetical protein